jgi:hypothetical protein
MWLAFAELKDFASKIQLLVTLPLPFNYMISHFKPPKVVFLNYGFQRR